VEVWFRHDAGGKPDPLNLVFSKDFQWSCMLHALGTLFLQHVEFHAAAGGVLAAPAVNQPYLGSALCKGSMNYIHSSKSCSYDHDFLSLYLRHIHIGNLIAGGPHRKEKTQPGIDSRQFMAGNIHSPGFPCTGADKNSVIIFHPASQAFIGVGHVIPGFLVHGF